MFLFVWLGLGLLRLFFRLLGLLKNLFIILPCVFFSAWHCPLSAAQRRICQRGKRWWPHGAAFRVRLRAATPQLRGDAATAAEQWGGHQRAEQLRWHPSPFGSWVSLETMLWLVKLRIIASACTFDFLVSCKGFRIIQPLLHACTALHSQFSGVSLTYARSLEVSQKASWSVVWRPAAPGGVSDCRRHSDE